MKRIYQLKKSLKTNNNKMKLKSIRLIDFREISDIAPINNFNWLKLVSNQIH